MKHGSEEKRRVMETLGRNIKQQLETGGLQQRDLAEKIGIAESNISVYCNGKHEMGVASLKKIADVLGVSLDTLMAQGE